MDSKLVVEQMAGNWKIKHPDMRTLAARAHQLAPAEVDLDLDPAGAELHADRLANEALDGDARPARRTPRATRPR